MSLAKRHAAVALLAGGLAFAARAAQPNADGVGELVKQGVGELVKQLDDRRFAVRDRADRELRRLGKDALPLVQKELKATKSEEVRQRLGNIIDYWMRDENQVAALIYELGSPLYHVREKATRALVERGKEIVPMLQKARDDAHQVEVVRRLELIIKKLSP